MAKVRVGGEPLRIPHWNERQAPNTSLPALSASTLMDAANETLTIVGEVFWEDGGTHDIEDVHWWQQTAGGTVNYTVEMGLADPEPAAGPPGRFDGTLDQSNTHASPGTGAKTTTFGTPRASVAHGSLLALHWRFSAWTSGTFGLRGVLLSGANRVDHQPVFQHFDGTSTYTNQQVAPCITVESSDGYIGHIAGGYPRLSGLNAETIDSATAIRRIALEFTVPGNQWAGGIGAFISNTSGGDFHLVLYEGTTELYRKVFDSNQWRGNSEAQIARGMCADIALTVGAGTYRVSLEPQNTNDVVIVTLDTSTASHWDSFAPNMAYNTHDGSAWSGSPTTTRRPYMYYAIAAHDDGSGGGGGGSSMLVHPGMAGGLRG